ncbi:hypothetical protein JEQ21_08170 [Streptococcus sp. 121]|uniref:hypothetical protein n=1 Tax=Streptococcus sp. 121 TaxID=2797637 RepID=UPI0018F0D5E0|nr:hypothetical protein [Streptococcus sp. 121]MBJ6746425.1 hypothetical protein [Streptococcus sp. 121]
MEKEILAKNEKASISLNTDGKIVIDAKEITTGGIDSGKLLSQDLLGCLSKGVEFLASNCIHSQIIITVDGISLQDTKEFHPASETLLD